MLNVFINTWGNYNENGADGGEWVRLPMDADELEVKLEEIAENMGDDDPEFCIHDYEWLTEIELRDISEMESITDLNEELNEYSDLDEWDQKEIAAAMEAWGYDFAEAYEKQQAGRFVFYANMDLKEVAEELVNECYFDRNTPDWMQNYFDYERFTRDLGYDGYEETSYGVIYEG